MAKLDWSWMDNLPNIQNTKIQYLVDKGGVVMPLFKLEPVEGDRYCYSRQLG